MKDHDIVLEEMAGQLRRCRTISALLREAHRLGDEELPGAHAPRRLLHVLAAGLGADRAALFHLSDGDAVTVMESIGMEGDGFQGWASPPDLGEFRVLAPRGPESAESRFLLQAASRAHVLWARSDSWSMAVLLGAKAGRDARAVYDEADRPVVEEAMALVAEVTERRMKLRALHESEERFRGFVENMGDAAFRADVEGRMTYVNHMAARMIGIPEEEIVGRSFLELFEPTSRDVAAAAHPRILSGESATDEVTFVNGVVAQVVAEPLRSATGEVIGVFGTCRDVTAARQMEKTLHNLVEHSLQGLVIFQDGSVVFSNSVAAEVLGFSQSELAGAPADNLVESVVHPDDREMVGARLRARLEGRDPPANYAFRVLKKDGTEIRVYVDASRTVFNGRPAVQSAFLEVP